jgi:hypothetical protein
MVWKLRVTRRDAMRGGVAGMHSVAAREAAHSLFHAGGQTILPVTVQRAVRSAVEGETARVLAGVGMLEAGAAAAAPAATGASVARAAATHTVRMASRHVLRSVSLAAGAGALVDGGWALVHAARCLRRGTMTRREAAIHVAREAGTGAAATAAGTAAAALLVTLTGGVAAPAVFLVGAVAAVGAKAGLDVWLTAKLRGQIRARRVPVEHAPVAEPATA